MEPPQESSITPKVAIRKTERTKVSQDRDERARKAAEGREAYSKRADEVRDVICRMREDQLWDSVKAADLDPKIIDYVMDRLKEGMAPHQLAKSLGLSGLNSKEWKKIQAYFRQGFRADAEAYLWQQTHKYYKVIDKAKAVLEDAFLEGTPHVVVPKDGEAYTIRVKGATKELAGFIDAYSRAIEQPVRLWKAFGAIGEKKDLGPGGVTILVQNNIPMPSIEDIKKHQDELIARTNALEVKKKEIFEDGKS